VIRTQGCERGRGKSSHRNDILVRQNGNEGNKEAQNYEDDEDTDYSNSQRWEGRAIGISVPFWSFFLFWSQLRIFAYIHLLGVSLGLEVM
jgi:hypothetical protein